MDIRIKEYMCSHKDEMLSVVSELVSIPSVKSEPSENAPFGKETKKALDKMLEICEKFGFKTSCCKNAVGTADYSPDGSIYLGILGHLDVVPADAKNWKSDPYKMEIRDGRIFGRGVIDDKGPLAAALFAIRCIKELEIPLRKGVRLIFGTDEENGSEDLEIYLENEKLPECVFTPDASFPVINIEKGMMRSRFEGEYDDGDIISFSGGSIPNAVPDYAECIIKNTDIEIINKAIAENGTEALFSAEKTEENVIIACKGRAAHASTPESGINAVTALIKLLSALPLRDGKQKDIICGLSRLFPSGETDGSSIGLKAYEEKSGALTLVFSIFKMDNARCEGCIDVRFPTCLNLSEVEKAERKALASAKLEFASYSGDEPHCVDENSDFVKKLLSVYENAFGEKGKAVAIGGGTYVHNIEGGVAFGVERGDTDYHLHGADEFIPIEELIDDAVIFAEAITAICG